MRLGCFLSLLDVGYEPTTTAGYLYVCTYIWGESKVVTTLCDFGISVIISLNSFNLGNQVDKLITSAENENDTAKWMHAF